MKKQIIGGLCWGCVLGVVILSLVQTNAADLYFSTAVASNDFNGVLLNLQGPASTVCEVQRLNRTNQTWDAMGTVTLDGSGTGSFSTTLHEGVYGYFRARTTNNAYFSTNAFGAVAGALPASGKTMIGNPFGSRDVSEIIPFPSDGLTVNKWDNANNRYITASYDAIFGQWSRSLSIGTQEGVIVQNFDTNQVRYLVSGLFTTNAVYTGLPSGFSILCSPLYQITVSNSYIVDTLNGGSLGGNSLLPVSHSGYDPQSIIYQMVNTSGLYRTNILTTGSVWQTNGVTTSVNLNLTEGFWINNPTSDSWYVSKPIW